MIGWLGTFGTPARADNPMLGPQLTSIFPAGGRQGTKVDVQIAGTDLDDAASLAFSNPGLSAVPKTAVSKVDGVSRPIDGEFTVTITGDVPPGLYEVRAAGPSGITNARTFAVGALDEIIDRSPPDTFAAAREVPLNTTINGVARAEHADYYRFTAKRGQRVLLEAWARRIDSKLDPRIVVYDLAGHELAHVKERIHRDALVDFIAPADGSYIAKMYDFLFSGGPNYGYRLTLSTTPHVDFVMPPSGLAGTKSTYSLYGRNLPHGVVTGERTASGTPLERLDVQIQLPSDPNVAGRSGSNQFAEPTQFGQNAFTYRLKTARGESNPANIYFASAPVVRQTGINSTPAKAQKLSLPCEVAGRFDPRRGRDWYQFDARKGDVWMIDVISQRLGLPTDPYLLVQRVNRLPDGKEQMTDVAAADDTGLDSHHTLHESFLNLTSADPSLQFVAPEDGTYRVMVRDLYGQSRGSPEMIYRLAIHKPQPDFHPLVLEEAESDTDTTDRMNLWSAVVRPGRTAAVDVLVRRDDGFTGAVQVTVDGLPDSISCPGATVGPGADVASLVFTAKESKPAGKVVKAPADSKLKSKDNAKSESVPTPVLARWNGPLRIVAKAKIGDRDVTHVAEMATSVWPEEKTTEQPVHFRLAPQFTLATGSTSMPEIKIHFGDGKPVEAAPGASVKIPVAIERGPNATGGLQCWFAGACPGMNFSVLVVPPDTKAMAIIMNVTSQLPPGEYSLPLRAYATVTCRDNPEEADAATVRMKQTAKTFSDLDAASKKAASDQKQADRVADKADAAVRHALEAMAAATHTLHESDERAQAATKDYAALQKEAIASAARLMAADSAVTDADRRAADAKSDQQTAAQKTQHEAIEAARRARDENHLIVVRRDAALALAQAAQAQRLTVEGEKAAVDRKLADAIAAAKAASTARSVARTAASATSAKRHAAEDEKHEAEIVAGRAVAFAQPQAFTIMYYSNPITLKVEPAPLKISASLPSAVKPGEKVELPISLERRFGFADVVTAGLVLPQNASGIHAVDISIPAGKTKSKLLVMLDPKAKPGKYDVSLHARMTFNGQPSQMDEPLVLNVAPVDAKSPASEKLPAKAAVPAQKK